MIKVPIKIFSYPLIAGDPNTAMKDLNSVLISDRLALKYFGNNWKDNNVIGRTLRIDNSRDFTVTGVFENPSSNSSLQFNWLIPAREYIRRNDWVENWGNGGFSMVITLKKGTDVEAFAKKVEQEINNHTNNPEDERLFIQKYSDRYLHGAFENGVSIGGRIDYVRIFMVVAMFILVIACINFMNLATARASQRAQEIGLRKVMGAQKGTLKHPGGAAFFRKGLVIFQFAISILLIIGTLTVSRQMGYIMNKNLGMERGNLIFIELEGETAKRFETYKNELLNVPEVQNVTSTSGNPLSYGRSSSSPSWEGKDPDETVEMNILMVSTDFIETMDMELIHGRDFSDEYGTDSANFIINEEAARIMGFENPVGERLSVWGMVGQIIGMVKNFHMGSMYEPIPPLVIRYDPQNTFVIFIRIRGNEQDALPAIRQVTSELNPSFPFAYEFLDEEYKKSYRSEMNISTLSNIFATMAIFISCLGLFGLSSFSAEQRTKEIGIRKVLGANVAKLMMLLSKDYIILILLAFIISAPIAYYFASGWLDKFVYKTGLGLDVFVISGIAAILVVGFTVSFKSFQAASANPVDTLKEE